MRNTLLWMAALTASTVFADPITIPLYRRNGNGIVRTDAQELDNGVLGGKVLIGTPPQEFTMAFDTNSGYSWVRGFRCKSENCLGRSTYYSTQSETAVSTGQKFKVKYGDACVETTIYFDDVQFGSQKVNMPFGGAYRMTGFDHGFDGFFGLGRDVDFNRTTFYSSIAKNLMRRGVVGSSGFVTNAYQQSTIKSAQFGMYTTSSSDNGFGQSGSAASGPTTTTTTTTTTTSSSIAESKNTAPARNTTIPGATNVTTPFTTTTATTASTPSSGGITSGGFGFIKRHNTEAAGYLILGGVDKSVIKGDVHYIDLAESSNGSWDLPISLVRFDMDLVIQQKKNAVASVSTSEQFIIMPADQADIYHEIFGGKFHESTQTYKVKCSKIHTLPRLKLYLGNYAVEIPPQYWTRVIDHERDCCATRIARGSSEKDWVLGTSFTNLFYTTFDPIENKIGLAFKKDQKEDGLKLVKKF